MVAGQRHLGGADQVEVVGLDPVHLVGVGAQKSGAGHHLRAHQHRRDHRDEAVLDGQPQRQLQQAQLQQRAPTGQEVEPRAGHLGAALHVDETERLAELQVVFRVLDRGGLADHVEDRDSRPRPPAGTPSMMTFEIAMCAAVNAVSASACAASAALTCSASSLARCQQRRAFVGRRGAHALARGLLLGAQRVGGRNRGAAGGVGRQQGVHQRRVLAAAELRAAHGVGSSRSSFRSITARRLLLRRGRMAAHPHPAIPDSHLQHLSRRLRPCQNGPMSDAPETEVSEPAPPAGSADDPARTAAAGRLPVAACVAGDGDQAGAATHRARRPADRRTGHRDSRSAPGRGGWPAISTAIRCPAPEPRATPPSTAPTAVIA